MRRATDLAQRLLETDPDEVDPKGYVQELPSPFHSLQSQTKPADRGTASLAVVLRQGIKQGEWVTRIKNMDNGGESWGHYFDDYERAYKDYQARCLKYGIPALTAAKRYVESKRQYSFHAQHG